MVESVNDLFEPEVVPAPRSRAKSRFTMIALFILGIVALWLGFCLFAAWINLRPDVHPLRLDPMSSGMAFEPFQAKSSDGTRLAGWLIPAGPKPLGIVVLCHGVGSNKSHLLGKAERLHKLGYTVAMFDFRGRGESEAVQSTIGYRETSDLVAVMDYLPSIPSCKNLSIAVLGDSQGAAVALMAAAERTEIRCVVAESPFSRLDRAIDNHFRRAFGFMAPVIAGPTRWFGERLIGTSSTNVCPEESSRKLGNRPILLIEDGQDSLCPPSEQERIRAAASGPVEVWLVEGAGHVCAFAEDPQAWSDRVGGFLQKELKR